MSEDQETTAEQKGLLEEAIEYHESMIPDLDPEGDIDKIDAERAFHQDRIDWLKELATLRGIVVRRNAAIEEFQRVQEQRLVEAGGVTKGAIRRLNQRLSSAKSENKEQKAKLDRYDEILDSAHRQNRRLIEDNIKLKEQKAALGDVIADLKMDLKARE